MATGLDGVKVLSATFAEERERLGDRLTEWLRANPDVRVTDVAVRQSSDARFHCLSIVVFYELVGRPSSERDAAGE